MGVWEALFYEEKQDWVTCVVNSVFTVANLAVELPCTLLALISTALIMTWDYTCQGAQQVSDFLALEEWWSLEHTLWTIILLQAIPMVFRRAAGDKLKVVLQYLSVIQQLSLWGSLLFMLNGLQGGVVFGGKLYHPTIAFVAILCQCFKATFENFRLDMVGIGHDKVSNEQRFNTVYDAYKKVFGYEVAFYLLLGTFGLPQLNLNGDPNTWLVGLPLLAIGYYGQHGFLDAVAPIEKTDANGTPPQVAEEKKAEEEPKKAEEPAAEEKKEDEEKKDETKEEKKVSPVNQVLEMVCGAVCKCCSACKACVDKVCCLVNLVKDKILGLPWMCLYELLTTVGITVALTYAFWTLTEDNLVFVAPSVSILAPYLLDKVQEKNWLDAKGAHLATEVLKTAVCGVQYHLFRTHISLPF